MAEKRAVSRRRVFKGGIITFGGAGVGCTVRNMSSRGAALDVGNATAIPPTFKLVIAADDFLARCRIIWNRDGRIGVAFD
ncbi:MAG: PilZ domain-containing protein [Pseudomonadota bacterium]|jgi:hypothetical protein